MNLLHMFYEVLNYSIAHDYDDVTRNVINDMQVLSINPGDEHALNRMQARYNQAMKEGGVVLRTMTDYFGNTVDVIEGNVKVGDRIVIADVSGSLVSHIPTRRYVVYTVRELIENGNRVRVRERGGSWAKELCYKLVEEVGQ